ncbi:hypothetical protein V5O48_003727 [Marasmius crinis-equi]|uniref:Uncharacterized protein n=1 Tax=Marasmius crinis-equi TaxID=585013 RepID=A0ABR3FST3_9AGAR
MPFIREIVAGATTYGPWHDSSGILSLGTSDNGESRVHMMRGYIKLYQGNNTPADLKTFLGSYIAIQYHAVTNISRFLGSNIYGSEWDKEPSGTFSAQSQTAAISVLVSGMTLSQGGDSRSPDPDPMPSTNTSASVPKGAIAGVVAGGIAGIGLIVLAIWLYRRRKHWMRESSDPEHIVNPLPLLDSRLKEERKKPDRSHAGDPTGISAIRQNDSKRSETRDASHTSAEDCPNTVGEVAPFAPQSVDNTIENLLLALNRRLRDERRQGDRQWDPEESPPRYPDSVQG